MAIYKCFWQYMEQEKIDNSETSKKVSKSQKSRQILTSCCNFPKESYVLTSFSWISCFGNLNKGYSKMFRSTASFDRMLERATSNLLLEPDWNAILQICDSIRSGDTNPKYAVTSIKKKIYHDNPHVVLYALTVSTI